MSSRNSIKPSMSMQSEKENGPLDLSAIPKNVPSLCIPRVFPNISSERVEAVFNELNIGRIERVDMVVRTGDKGETLKRVFVHLEWNDSENARKARERLLCGNDVKVIYEDPWFWKVSANRSTRDLEPRNNLSRGQGPRNDMPRNDMPRNDRSRNDRPRNDRPRPRGPLNMMPKDDLFKTPEKVKMLAPPPLMRTSSVAVERSYSILAPEQHNLVKEFEQHAPLEEGEEN